MDINTILKVIFLSMLPVGELRVALPYAVKVMHIKWYYAYILSVLGNMIPVPFILLLMDFAVKILSHIPFMDRFFQCLFARTRKRSKIIERLEFYGLIFFVAIPLPVTGAWTGALAAYLFGISFWKSILGIFIGVSIAGVIVLTLTLLGWIGAGIAIAALTLWLVLSILASIKNKNAETDQI